MSYDDLGLDTTPEVSEDELGLDTTPEVSDDEFSEPSPKVSLIESSAEILMKLQVTMAASRKAATIAGHDAAAEVNKKVELYITARADWRRTLERRKRRKVCKL